jgi:hypothetical protein
MSGGDRALLDGLVNVRRNIAAAKGVSEAQVMSHEAMMEIVKRKPKNVEELMRIKGIGSLEGGYGAGLVEAVKGSVGVVRRSGDGLRDDVQVVEGGGRFGASVARNEIEKKTRGQRSVGDVVVIGSEGSRKDAERKMAASCERRSNGGKEGGLDGSGVTESTKSLLKKISRTLQKED